MAFLLFWAQTAGPKQLFCLRRLDTSYLRAASWAPCHGHTFLRASSQGSTVMCVTQLPC
jgi:hypothetical protein